MFQLGAYLLGIIFLREEHFCYRGLVSALGLSSVLFSAYTPLLERLVYAV